MQAKIILYLYTERQDAEGSTKNDKFNILL